VVDGSSLHRKDDFEIGVMRMIGDDGDGDDGDDGDDVDDEYDDDAVIKNQRDI
jgi:hypothetical protein